MVFGLVAAVAAVDAALYLAVAVDPLAAGPARGVEDSVAVVVAIGTTVVVGEAVVILGIVAAAIDGVGEAVGVAIGGEGRTDAPQLDPAAGPQIVGGTARDAVDDQADARGGPDLGAHAREQVGAEGPHLRGDLRRIGAGARGRGHVDAELDAHLRIGAQAGDPLVELGGAVAVELQGHRGGGVGDGGQDRGALRDRGRLRPLGHLRAAAGEERGQRGGGGGASHAEGSG
ncbi:hypothetical protein [Nannocystis pusilla]|uniref:hypothetical protein n=1 Tax=Nannocystis pusilla TaxID=889268 RepID=UPI003DA296DB